MEYLGLLVMGILLSTLGIVNIMGNISTIHAWNRKRSRKQTFPGTDGRSARVRL